MELRRVVLQLIFLGVAAFTSSVAQVLECACEPVLAEVCSAEYNKTIFPNKVNKFSTREDAMKEFQSFSIESLTLESCSSMLKTFLCSYYFPPCLENLDCQGVGPCDTLCEQVRSSCEPTLEALNLTWPEHLNCSKFPTLESADPYCIPSTPPTAITVEPSCEIVNQPICASLHPNYTTSFPNRDLITQTEADTQFQSFVPALSSNCSSMLKVFLCASHYPVCTEISPQIYPCDYFCEEVKNSCEPFMLKHNASWPDFLNCSNFPNKNESICIDSTFTPSPPPTLPTPDVDTCEPILPEVLDICGDIHPNYTMTHFPYGQFTSQRQAIETLKNYTEFSPYLKLIDEKCAPELKPFLCLNFFPSCSPTQPIKVVKPCRNVCRKAHKGCSESLLTNFGVEWHFDCDDYHVHDTCLSLNDLKLKKNKNSSKDDKQ